MILELPWKIWYANRAIKIYYCDEIKPEVASAIGGTVLHLYSLPAVHCMCSKQTGSWPLGSWQGARRCWPGPCSAATSLLTFFTGKQATDQHQNICKTLGFYVRRGFPFVYKKLHHINSNSQQ